MDGLRIQILDPEEFSDQWETFSIKDSNLTGEEWNARDNELIKILSSDFLYTGLESAPADFFVGQDWFQTRVQCVVFFSWHFLCRRMLQSCKEFVTRNIGWGVSIVSNAYEMDQKGPGIEMMLTSNYIKMAAHKYSRPDLRKFLVKRTDLAGWILT